MSETYQTDDLRRSTRDFAQLSARMQEWLRPEGPARSSARCRCRPATGCPAKLCFST